MNDAQNSTFKGQNTTRGTNEVAASTRSCNQVINMSSVVAYSSPQYSKGSLVWYAMPFTVAKADAHKG